MINVGDLSFRRLLAKTTDEGGSFVLLSWTNGTVSMDGDAWLFSLEEVKELVEALQLHIKEHEFRYTHGQEHTSMFISDDES